MTAKNDNQTEPILEKVEENLDLPRHLIQAKDWAGLERVLCDLLFLEKKIAAGLTYELNEDFRAALEALPENQENIRRERDRQELLDTYARDLVAYSKGEIRKLEILPSVERRSDAELDKELKRIFTQATRLDRLSCFAGFVSGESHHLLNYGAEPLFCLRQACNHANDGPVAKGAHEIIHELKIHQPILLGQRQWLPAFNPHPASLATLEGHTGTVMAVAVTADGRRAVSGDWHGKLCVWDIEQGRCLRTLRHPDEIRAVAVAADGRRAVAGGGRKERRLDIVLRVWDLKSGRCLSILQGHSAEVNAVAVTADGSRAVSASDDQTLRVWDLETGRCLRILEGHSSWVRAVAMTADGRQAVSASGDHILRVWDLELGRCLVTLDGHSDDVSAVAVTPDDRQAVSGSWDHTLRVWDLETGRCLKILDGDFFFGVNAVAVTADGRRVVWCGSFTDDSALRVWDLETGRCLSVLKGHTGSVLDVALTADSRWAVSASDDRTLRLWDLEQGVCLRVLKGHSRPVAAVVVTADGRRAVSASWDWTLRVWDLERDHCLSVTAFGAVITSLALMGETVVAGLANGHVEVLQLVGSGLT
ncbi:MAG: hypothetical protein HY892_02850 [Deltaproteobacteria bacterium]|nr:hypothetical protein [Deltaproteobacteria bacterium]